ncbi:MAG: ABC transporter ATP-binding protein [Microbacteriaceae bacterium]|nr:ABC transporter ATP-binding protein [Microbacteriaceae bacterium]
MSRQAGKNEAAKPGAEPGDTVGTEPTTQTGPTKYNSKSKPVGTKAAKPHRATFGELASYLFAEKKLLTAALFCGAFAALTALLQPGLVGQIIVAVETSQAFGMLATLLIICVATNAIFNALQHYTLQRMGEGVVLRSRLRLIRKLLFLPISQFDQRRSGDLVSRIGSDTTLLRAALTQGLVEAMTGVLVLIGSLICMVVLDPVLFLATVAVLAGAALVAVLIALRMRPLSAQTQQQVGDLAASVQRAVGAIRTIRAAGASEQEEKAISSQAQEAYRLGLRTARLSAMIVPLSFIALELVFLVVLGLGGFRVATGALTIANMVAFLLFVFLMIAPLGNIFGAVFAVNQALGALGRIQEITRLESETDRDTSLSPSGELVDLGQAGSSEAPALEFVDVHFSYRSAAPDRVDARKLVDRRERRKLEFLPPQIVETPVLHGVSFAVPRGKTVALVGPSGSGKSTILGLMERFADPDSGSIRFAGVDLRDLPRDQLRAQLGYVEQDAPALAGSIRDNLLLAAPGASDEDCLRVLQQVNLLGLVEREGKQAGLASGLDAPVGEQGVLLSGGEKQRLAIARALLADAPVLLLDESTANLDSVNEQMMRQALQSVARERTLVVVAHRLATVVDSDLIVVLQSGRVVGSGTHAELLENVPLYRELAAHQLLA